MTSITRAPEKASTDRADLDQLLDACLIAHVGFAVDHQPVVIPTAMARDGDQVLVHGSTGSRWMRRLSTGVEAALAVTTVEGLVVARSAFESSMHYRSAVLFGAFTPVEGAAKGAALDLLTEHLLPGRVAEVRRPTTKELAATLVVAMPIVRWSLKISDGWPEDPESDVTGDTWAGVVPVTTRHGKPRPAPDLRSDISAPDSVRALL